MKDEVFLEYAFWGYFGKKLCLEHPRTFNEKIQWLKLYNRRPEYVNMVDKYAVREYITKTIGSKYLIPLIGEWEDPNEICFDDLPDKFVLKCNHNSGTGMFICKDKSKINVEEIKQGLRDGLKEDYYSIGREWPYKDVARKIVCEKYIETNSNDELADYKIHCFNGMPKLILVCQNRFSPTGLTEDFFDTEWNHLNISRETSPNARERIQKPSNLELMLELAKTLSTNIPFLRVDFYETNGELLFGELTFFPASGFAKFFPDEWDEILGSWLELPIDIEKRKHKNELYNRMHSDI